MTTVDPTAFDDFVDEYEVIATFEEDNQPFIDWIPSGRGAALDIGCGTGVLAHELSERFETVTAIDISAPMLERARQKRPAPNIEYIEMAAEELEFESKFDYIVSRNTFHHIERLEETLALMRAHLNPGGRIVVIDCTAEGPDLRWSPPLFRLWIRSTSLLGFLLHSWRHGIGAAGDLFRAQTSPIWIEHLLLDRYLSPDDFHSRYGAALPGARFEKVGWFWSSIWDAPREVK